MQATPDQVAAFRGMRTPADVAALLQTSEKRLYHLLYRAPPAYRAFNLPKASGGHRPILAPPPVLKAWQRVVLACMSAIYLPTRAVHGFAPDRSVVTNARVHVGRRLILNLDLENFFPTIHFGRARGVLQTRPFQLPPNIAAIVAHLCCVNGRLPQGAPTSPLISNLVCRGLDHQLVALARATGCRYSRYVDDITLSTDKTLFDTAVVKNGFCEPPELGDALLQIIASNTFQVNGTKTRLRDSLRHQEVTGLTVNARVNVHRTYIKAIRGALFSWSKHGEAAAAETFHTRFGHLSRRQPPATLRNFLRGRLAFLKMVRGEQDGIYQRYAVEFAKLAAERPVTLAGPQILTERLLLYSLWIVVGKDAHGQDTSNGTGFTTRDFGVITSHHVLQDRFAVRWEAIPAWNQGLRYSIKEARVSPDHDLAAFDAPCKAPATLIVDPTLPSIAAPVVLAGFPNWRWQHDRVHVQAGTVASTQVVSTVHHILTTAQVQVGNSGGPLLNGNGRVVGIARYAGTSAIAPNGSVAAQHLQVLLEPTHFVRQAL